MKNQNILIAILVLIIIVGGVYFASNKKAVAPAPIVTSTPVSTITPVTTTITNPTPINTNTTEPAPVITSITPTTGPTGTMIEVKGKNLAGFEGDKNLWIVSIGGLEGIVYGEAGSTDTLIKFKLASSYCTKDTSYSGLPCPSSLSITPGIYKIYAKPWGTKSNVVQLTVTASPTPSAPITVLSPNGGEVIKAGSKYTVKWNDNSGDVSNVNIFLVDTRTDTKVNVSGALSQRSSGIDGTNSYAVTIPANTLVGTNVYKIAVVGKTGSDSSDTFFSVTK